MVCAGCTSFFQYELVSAPGMMNELCGTICKGQAPTRQIEADGACMCRVEER